MPRPSTSSSRQSRIDRVTEYARQVTTGKVIACKEVRQACERHLRDLVEGPGRGLTWIPALAEWAIEFFGYLRHSKGSFAGKRLELEPWQCFVVGSVFGWKREDGTRRFRKVYEEIPRKNGKALSVDTPVPTPTGWTLHGDLRPGDMVFGEDGIPVRVLAVTEHYEGSCFEVSSSDGTSIVAHERHEWKTGRSWFTGKPKGKRGSLPLVETKRIAQTLRTTGSRPDLVHSLPRAHGITCEPQALPIPPYTLGAWLGDGNSGSARITFGDEQIADAIRAEGVTAECRHVRPGSTIYQLGRGSHRGPNNGSLHSALRCAGLLNSKHIPTAYLRASREQRLELLRGLMDTDGHCTAAGQCELVLCDRRLFDDAVELIRTLGIKVTTVEDRAFLRGRDVGPRYRAQFFAFGDVPVFRLERKALRLKPRPEAATRSTTRMIADCSPVGTRLVNCIQVEGGMYLAGRGFVATHNSTKLSGVGLLCLIADDEAGAEVYAAATKKDQARIVFDEARRMVRASPELSSKASVFKLNISVDATSSKFEPLSADERSLDGLNPHCVIIDELHKHKTDSVLNVLDTALGARLQPLLWIITTAGSEDPETPYAAENAYASNILAGVLEDDGYFVFITKADDPKKWDDPIEWAKANPNLGVSVQLSYIEQQARQAKGSPARLAAFKRLNLNVRTSNTIRPIDAELWDTNTQGPIDLATLRGRQPFVAADLSSRIDLTAKVDLFPPMEVGERWKVTARFWIPEAMVDEASRRDRAPYRRWIDDGWMEASPGNVIDQQLVFERLQEDAERHPPLMVAFDPNNANWLDARLEAAGIERKQFPQTIVHFNPPTKELLAMLKEGKIEHGGNPVLRWMAANVSFYTDGNQNLRPSKKSSRSRIDGIVALIMAIGLSMVEAPAAPGVEFV